MRVGVALYDITPDEPVDLAGYVERCNPSDGVLDRLYVRALYIEHERSFTVLTCDVHSIPTPFAMRLRRMVAEEIGVEEGAVWVVATHTHSAPGLGKMRGCGSVNEGFSERVLYGVLRSAVSAMKNAEKVDEFLVTALPCYIAANRRMPTPDGVARIPNPEGSYDPQVLWLRLVKGGMVVAQMVVYGCHPVTLGPANRKIGTDFVGPLLRMLEEHYGGVALFLPGALGDVDPVPAYRAEPNARDDFAERLFETIRDSEFLTERIEPEGPFLMGGQRALPLLEIGRPEIEEWRRRARSYESEGELRRAAVIYEWMEDFRLLREMNSLPETVPLFAAVADFGQLRIVAVSAEVFSSYGLILRAHCPAPYTAVVSLANGFIGHLPDEEAFLLGGYEVEEAVMLYGILPLAQSAGEVAENYLLSLVRYERQQ